MIKEVVLFSLVYSVVVNLVSYVLYVPSEFSAISSSMPEITQKTESMYKGVVGIPLIDLGGLIFYTGNIIVDFLMNFVTAIPSVVTLLIDVFFRFFPIQTQIASTFKLGIYTILSAIIVINLVIILLRIRSRGAIT